MSSEPQDNSYTVIFRNSTVVEDRIVAAPSMSKAARAAERMTAATGDFPGWTVYSVTLGVRG